MVKYLFWLLLPMSLHAIEVPAEYYPRLVELCKEHNVPLYYTARLIQWESGFNPRCINVNPNGTVDEGIMALNSNGLADLARWHNNGVMFDPYDWHKAMEIGIKHLRYLYVLTGSWWGAVAAYNMGYRGFCDWMEGKKLLPDATKKELTFVFG